MAPHPGHRYRRSARLSQLKVSVAEILNRPGEYRDLDLRPAFEDVRTELAHLGTGPLDTRLKAESVVEGILVSGRVAGTASLRCARCLKDFDGSVSLDVCELFTTPGHELPEEEAYKVQGMEIDLGPMLRDALVLALPLNPVCDEACMGLCAGCGKNLNHGECECEETGIDPRWAGLTALREKLNG
jgi:uncharacterized protein